MGKSTLPLRSQESRTESITLLLSERGAFFGINIYIPRQVSIYAVQDAIDKRG